MHDDTIRAWKDPEYRRNLSEEERSRLPENPAGTSELDDAALDMVLGGQMMAMADADAAAGTQHVLTLGCCGGLTSDPGYCSLGCGGTTGACPGCTDHSICTR